MACTLPSDLEGASALVCRRCRPAGRAFAAPQAAASCRPSQSAASSSGRHVLSSHRAHAQQRVMRVAGSNNGNAVTTEDDVVRVASVGDMVTLHFLCKTPEGEVLESSYEANEPLCFEVGAGDMMGNKLFQGFDEAVRGLAVGQKTELEASGGEWRQELLFSVPIDHPEVQRLQGRYKNHGGLHRGLLVELANGAMAMVVDVTDAEVKIDANNMMAGKKLVFELEVVEIQQGDAAHKPAN